MMINQTFPHPPHDDKSQEQKYGGWQFLKDMLEESKKQHALVAADRKENCTHEGNYKIAPSPYVIVRFCACCGKSWRMWAKPSETWEDYPLAEWEEIKEPVEVPPIVASDDEE